MASYPTYEEVFAEHPEWLVPHMKENFMLMVQSNYKLRIRLDKRRRQKGDSSVPSEAQRLFEIMQTMATMVLGSGADVGEEPRIEAAPVTTPVTTRKRRLSETDRLRDTWHLGGVPRRTSLRKTRNSRGFTMQTRSS